MPDEKYDMADGRKRGERSVDADPKTVVCGEGLIARQNDAQREENPSSLHPYSISPEHGFHRKNARVSLENAID